METPEQRDVALLIPSWSDTKDWRDRTHLYVHQQPLAVAEGSRVWLCKERRLFHSYRIDGFVELSEALPGSEGGEQEHGWALAVSDGKRANRDLDNIPDPHGVAARWMQGFRYLAPGAHEFVKAPRRPRTAPAAPPATGPAPAPVEPDIAAHEEQPASPAVPAPAEPTWAGRLARRLRRGREGHVA